MLSILISCVPTKKYNDIMNKAERTASERDKLSSELSLKNGQLEDCNTEKENLNAKNVTLNKKLEGYDIENRDLKSSLDDCRYSKSKLLNDKDNILSKASETENDLTNQLSEKKRELNKITAEQALLSKQLGGQKEELRLMQDLLDKKASRIQELEDMLSSKEKALQDLKQNISNALKGFSSDEINVEDKNGKLYVSLSEKLLFSSGSYEVDSKGREALNALASALKNQKDFEIVVEGHTDNVPIKGSTCLIDNWDLSAKRATSVARILLKNKEIPASIVSASGRSESLPVAANNTAEGKAKNRRTEIILSPNLDKLFSILAN